MAADRVVERLVVAIKYAVDQTSLRNSLSSYTQVSSAIAAATLAVAGFTIAQAAQLDEVAKTARALSMTTEEYTALTHAANIGGVSQSELGTALRSLTLRLGAAGAGSKEASDDFARLGISIRDANGNLKTAGQVLPEFADALKSMSQGDAAALMVRNLGRSGLTMKTFLDGGSESIRELTAEAEDLGVVLDSETAASAERLTDSVTRMWAIVKGFGFQLSGELMPRLADVIDSFVGWAKANDGILRSGIERGVRALGLALDYLATPVGKVAAGMVAVGAAIGAGQAAGGLIGAMRLASPAINAVATSMGGLSASMALPVLGAVGLALVLEDLWVTSQGGDSVTRRLAAAFGVEDETVRLLAGSVEVLSAASEAMAALFRESALASVDALTSGLTGLAGALTGIVMFLPNLLGLKWEDTPMVRFGNWLASFLPSLSAVMDALGGAFDFGKATQGFKMLSRFAAGDSGVQLNQDRGAINRFVTAPVTGVAQSARERAGVTVSPTINVNAGASKADIRAESFRVFGQELDMALSTAGVL